MPYYGWQGEEITRSEWARLFVDERHIGEDYIDGIGVSTVWLGLDYGPEPDAPPLIFETMVFGGAHDERTWRYATESEARIGHAYVVEMVRTGALHSRSQ